MTLEPFFAPEGVVVVGVSQDPSKLGYAIARNLACSGYNGAVHLVNPRGGEVLGKRLYQGIMDVPDPVDLAVLLIPAPSVPQALLECAQRGIGAVIIASGGFREIGAEGAKIEAHCLELAREHNIRLVGPNCVGLLDTHYPLNTTFLPPPGPDIGDVALISQSGAMCDVVIDWARGQGFGISRLLSLGNQVDVTETDMLSPLVDDPNTRVITLYLEGIVDGRRFVEEAIKASRVKPLVALKVGRFAAGRKAAVSHTGALAGEDRAYCAAFKKAGVIHANTTEEMFDWARCLAWSPLPKGRRTAVLTNAGGPGVTAADAIEACGLELASLSDSTIFKLRSILPVAASVYNPVDLLPTATPELYASVLKLLMDDPLVDNLLVILPPPPKSAAGEFGKALVSVIKTSEKPVLGVLMGDSLICDAVELFRKERIPDYRFPERATSALAVLCERAEYLRRAEEEDAEVEEPEGICREAARAAFDDFSRRNKGGFIPQGIARRILESYGIPFLPEGTAQTPGEASALSPRIGFPAALKIISPNISHKSDVGGVRLDLKNEADVEYAAVRMIEDITRACPDAEVEGFLVQRMAPVGQEVIVGVVQDKQFGPLVMFGSGGAEVEGLKDIEFALAPVTFKEADQLMDSTWAGKKLYGYRNLPPTDRNSVLDSIRRISLLAADFPEIIEMEINPLRVLERGKGAFALDVRMVTAKMLYTESTLDNLG